MSDQPTKAPSPEHVYILKCDDLYWCGGFHLWFADRFWVMRFKTRAEAEEQLHRLGRPSRRIVKLVRRARRVA